MIVSAWNPGRGGEDGVAALPRALPVLRGRRQAELPAVPAFLWTCSSSEPLNIASRYSLLTMMMAQQTGLKPGEFVWTGGDSHVYDNHVDQFLEQLGRKPYPIPDHRDP